jgi:hypothetical protein
LLLRAYARSRGHGFYGETGDNDSWTALTI